MSRMLTNSRICNAIVLDYTSDFTKSIEKKKKMTFHFYAIHLIRLSMNHNYFDYVLNRLTAINSEILKLQSVTFASLLPSLFEALH